MTKRILAMLMALVMVFSCMPVHGHATEAAPAATGTTYYVSSLHGAEGNDGTSESAPFASLLKINEITLQPGDRVLLERGSVFVDEYLHIQGSGSAEAPIVIDAYGDESLPRPLIQTNACEGSIWYQDYGKRLDNTWHKYRGDVSTCILLFDVEYIEISSIAMTNEGNFKAGESYNTYGRMDRTGVAGIAQDKGTVDHIYLRDLEIYNVQGSVHDKHMANAGIYLLCHKPTDESATGPAKFDDVLIEGCRLDEVNRWGIAVGYTAHWDEFEYGPEIDPEVCQTYGSTNVVIRNNYLTNIGGDGITTMYCYQPVMEYNVLDGYCQDMTMEIYGNNNQRVAAGIWPWMCKTPILQYNEAYNSTYCPDAQAWDADWGDNAIYQYNYSCNNAGGAVMFCGVHACNTVFRYNISQHDLAGVLNLAGSPNGELYNNVFFVKEGIKINRDGMSGGVGNKIYNNIFYYDSDSPASAVYGNWNAISGEWSNNVYYNYSTTPEDEHAITADPLFVDPGKGPTGAQANGLVHDRSVFDGYKLQPESPCIDAGRPIDDNGGLDFFGNEVDLIPDIGAYDAGTFEADAERAVIVDVEVGETFVITDRENDYSGMTPVVEDDKIASVDISGSSKVVMTYGEAVTALETGDYILVNNRAGKTMTNKDASQQADAGSMSGLSLNGTKESVQDDAVWTIAPSGDGYTIQDLEGKYLTISSNDAAVVDAESVVTAAYNGNWTLSQNGAYLNDAANKSVCASGWVDPTAAADSGSQWTIYPTIEDTIYSTELTFTGLFPGTTNIYLGDTLYLVRVRGAVQEVELEVGETAEFTDETGNYTDADTTALDTSVATVELSGLMTEVNVLGSKVTELTSGNSYILVNTRAAKPVTNMSASNGQANGLALMGAKEDAEDAAIWTVTSADGGWTVQDLEGKYMTVGSGSAAMVDEPAVLSLNYSGSAWTISQNGAYLNDFGGTRTCAAGWQDASASYDSGSQWDIYEVGTATAETGTVITFTGVGAGETSIQIGNVMYAITVTAPYTDPADDSRDIPLSVLKVSAGDWQTGYEATEGPAELAVDNDPNTLWHTDWYGTSRADHWFQFELTDTYAVDGLRYQPRQSGNTNGIITEYEILVSDDGETFRSVASGNWEGDRSWKIAKFDGETVKYVRMVAVDALTDNSYVFASAAEIRLTGVKTDAPEHEHSYEAVVTEPTCTENGYTTYTCACGDSYVADETEALGHDYEIVVTEPTCTEEGYSTYTCKRCDHSFVDDTKPALGHSFGDWTVTTAPTCTEAGVETRACACGETETREVAAFGHTEEVLPAVEATCTETGLTEGKKCSVCDEILVAQEVIPALGHDFVNGDCTRCDAVKDAPFVDVPVGSFYFDPVEWAVEEGITTGVDANHFNPNGQCQRAVVVTFLWRAAGSPEPTSTVNPFTDVKESDFFYKAVLWAVEKGITNGLTATTFGPYALCNRAQVVTFLWRAQGQPAPTSTTNPFTDVNVTEWYGPAVLWAVEKGVTNGMGDGTFGVGGICNRAQVVTFLYRAMVK